MINNWRQNLAMLAASFLTAFPASGLAHSSPQAVPSVYLFGGGARPAEALREFVAEASGEILVVTWSTSEPDKSFEAIQQEVLMVGAYYGVRHAIKPQSPKQAKVFRSELLKARGVFLSGGDQNVALDLIEKFDLWGDFQSAQTRGVVFAGTSAGTAMLAPHAMTGEADILKVEAGNTKLRRGLGLVPFLVDQHFLVRGRQNRLMSALLDHPTLEGVGIDEDNAARYKHGKLKAFGQSPLSLYSYDSAGDLFQLRIIRP